MIEILVPRENVNDDSVVILQINFSSGSWVKRGDVVVSVETSKTNIDIEAPQDGVITHHLKAGSEVNVGELLFSLNRIQEPERKIERKSNIENSEIISNSSELTAKFSIAAKNRAKELGISLNQFNRGWVTSFEIEKSAGIVAPKFIWQQATSAKVISDNSREPCLVVSSAKRAISKRKQAEAQSLLVGNHGNTTSTIGIGVELTGERLIEPPFLFKDGISDLIVFEAAKLLRQYPELNGSYINEKTWSQYEQVNFGWSFDNGKNLKVLAIKDADNLSLSALQGEVVRLLELYDSGETIPLELLTNSTVTFSDLSRTSASFMLPLINGNQSLILGLARKSKYTYEIFASFDHRISEGLSVANFLAQLKSRLLSYYLDNNGVANVSCYACGKPMVEELSLGHRGFVKITLANGEGEHLCRNCFEGW